MLKALHLYTQKKAKPQQYFRAENRDIWGFLCLLGGKTMVVLLISFVIFQALTSSVRSFFGLMMLLNPVPLSSCNPWGSYKPWGCSSWNNGSQKMVDGEGPSELILGTLLLSSKAEQSTLALCVLHYSLSLPGHPHAMLPLAMDLQDLSGAL